MLDIVFFYRRILAVLRNREARDFEQILAEVDFSHNIPRNHLDQLIDQGLIERHKKPKKGLGRLRFIYSLSRNINSRTLSALLDPYKGLVVLPFEKLQHLCRHKMGGYCKKIGGRYEVRNCLQIVK